MTKTGELFGRFAVYEQLGAGGMAVVHRAKWRGIEGFELDLALKRLRPQLADKPDVVAAFVHEAKLSARLQHNNVARTYELGKVGETYFIAQELVKGRDVKTILRRASLAGTRMPLAVVVWLLAELCDALDYTHNRVDDDTGRPLDIVHRDISPSNVMMTTTGHIKVIDFGIAEAVIDDTYPARVRGKYGYMSPEALRAERLDARSDIYSVGVLAYEALICDRLFTREEREARKNGDRLDPPLPPSLYRADCPRELDAIVLRALTNRRQDRWPSARILRDALQALARAAGLKSAASTAAAWLSELFAEDEETFTAVEISEFLAEMSTLVETPPA